LDVGKIRIPLSVIGPLQLGSRDQILPTKILYYGLQPKECHKWKERIKNTKMAKFEALELKSKLIQHFEFSENVEDLYGKCCWRARPCSPTTFSIQILFFLQKFRPS